MKQYLIVAFILASTVLMLNACGGANDNGTPNPSTQVTLTVKGAT